MMIDLYEELKDYNSIGIGAHIKPDGDAIGSSTALYLYLTKLFKDKKVYLFMDGILDCFMCLPGIENAKKHPEVDTVDVFLALDTTPERLGSFEKYFKSAEKTVNIDHHISNEQGSGDVNYVDPYSSSTSELIYRLIDKEYLDKDIATLLYIGIVHDTGLLRYSNTSPETMKICAKLIEYGFDFSTLVDITFYEKSFLSIVSSAKVCESAELHLNGLIISSCVSLKTMKKWNCTSNDLDGVINQLRIAKGTEVAVFMYQMNQNTYKVSMRSKQYIDVSKVAESFNGGGHIRAAGFYSEMKPEDIINKIVDLVKAQID